MEQKIIAFMRQNNMIRPNEHIVVACSGGADSICLLLFLKSHEESLGVSISALHVEHGIRGEESKQDAAFVKEFCRVHSIPLQEYTVDVPSYAKEHKIGFEEAARILRYKQLEKGASVYGGTVSIALAHHMEDNAETMLFQMVRGSGLSGLCGISPVRTEEHARFIRPLLCVSREEIEAYLETHKQSFCIDSTNADEDYSRNRIRNQLLPQLTAMNPQAIVHMNRSAHLLSETYDYVLQQAMEFFDKEVKASKAQVCVNVRTLQDIHPALCKEVLRLMLFRVTESQKDITYAHIDALAALLYRQSGRHICLPYGVTAFIEHERLCIGRQAANKRIPEVAFTVPADLIADSLQQEDYVTYLETDYGSLSGKRAKSAWSKEENEKKAYTKQFDYDKIKNGFSVRTRKVGDYLVIDPKGHRKKISDYMIDEKIPARLRDSILLLANGSEIIWVIGGRVGENYKIGEHTTQMIEIQYKGGISDGLCNES